MAYIWMHSENHIIVWRAERATATEAIKLLIYKWFGMWMEGGVKGGEEKKVEGEKEKEGEGRRVRRGEPAGVLPRVRIQLHASTVACMEALDQARAQTWSSFMPQLQSSQLGSRGLIKRPGADHFLLSPRHKSVLKVLDCICMYCMNLCVFYMCMPVYYCFHTFFFFFFFLQHHMVKDEGLILTVTTETRWLSVIQRKQVRLLQTERSNGTRQPLANTACCGCFKIIWGNSCHIKQILHCPSD